MSESLVVTSSVVLISYLWSFVPSTNVSGSSTTPELSLSNSLVANGCAAIASTGWSSKSGPFQSKSGPKSNATAIIPSAIMISKT